jgi:hypothetical protein
MQFDLIPVHAVKSISQRNLVIHWQALYARQGLPRFADFTPGERAHDPRRVLVWAVDRSSGETTYRHLYRGDYAVEAFGPVVRPAEAPQPLRDIILAGLDECATSGHIIYMSITAPDPSGNAIDCERLLLPFSDGGAEVTHILSSLELVSLDGSFDRQTVVERFTTQVGVTFSGRILPATANTTAAPAEKAATAG